MRTRSLLATLALSSALFVNCARTAPVTRKPAPLNRQTTDETARRIPADESTDRPSNGSQGAAAPAAESPSKFPVPHPAD